MMLGKLIFSFALVGHVSFAATTKVGSGDEGADLEGAKPIVSGPIFEARAAAVARLRALNIQGIQGLGFVIPEIENTRLFMAQLDVKPISSEGDWETSEGRELAYARTFPEPHAPTRFFPAALKLNREQLIALHTHEALHRALPPHVREDEEKVSLLTLALTSHSATFDRVNRIAQNVIGEPEKPRTWLAQSVSQSQRAVAPLPPSRKSEIDAESFVYSSRYNGVASAGKIGAEMSPIGTIRIYDMPVDPRFSGHLFALNDRAIGPYIGPLSLKLELPAEFEHGKTISPFARYSLRSLEATESVRSDRDRDVMAVGIDYERWQISSYSNVKLTYTLPDHFDSQKGLPAIWSFDARVGAKIRRFDLGATMGTYHMLSKGRSKAFTLIQAGPEVKYLFGRATIKLAASAVLNRRANRVLDELGDLAGHGQGDAQVSLGLNINL